jgi:hypothetical protein
MVVAYLRVFRSVLLGYEIYFGLKLFTCQFPAGFFCRLRFLQWKQIWSALNPRTLRNGSALRSFGFSGRSYFPAAVLSTPPFQGTPDFQKSPKSLERFSKKAIVGKHWENTDMLVLILRISKLIKVN